jgi:hypothetical protein
MDYEWPESIVKLRIPHPQGSDRQRCMIIFAGEQLTVPDRRRKVKRLEVVKDETFEQIGSFRG